MLKGVIVDLDSTLINSRPVHEGSLNDALERNGYPKLKEWVYGPTTEDLTHYNFPNMPQDVLKKVAETKKENTVNYVHLAKAIPGAEELLNFLKFKKIKVCP